MVSNRIVLKFGGTSVRDADVLRTAAGIVQRHLDRRPVVVVSAAAGVTNQLGETLELAGRNGNWRPLLDDLTRRHVELAESLGLSPRSNDKLLLDLGDVLHGVELLREITPRTWDLVLAFGESLLAPLFVGCLESLGVPARMWLGGELGLITDDRFGRARPLPEADQKIADALATADDRVPVITGFAGRTRSGEATTLGRGGSDYSASIIARAIGATDLQIWTDVDGILTADPKIVPSAQVIEQLSFEEASELAFSGARVLHPQTITPAMEGDIPVQVLNTHRPSARGTSIRGHREPGAQSLCSIAHKIGVRVVTVISPRMVARHGFIARIAAVFEKYGVSIDMISTSEVSVSFTTEDPVHRMTEFLGELRKFSRVEVVEGRGMISLVGSGIADRRELFGDVFQCLATIGVTVEMISYGATRINLSLLVPEEAVPTAVQALHGRYF